MKYIQPKRNIKQSYLPNDAVEALAKTRRFGIEALAERKNMKVLIKIVKDDKCEISNFATIEFENQRIECFDRYCKLVSTDRLNITRFKKIYFCYKTK